MVYTPDSALIYERASFDRYLRNDLEWDMAVVISIMIYDLPSIETTKRMIKRYGPTLAEIRIKHFLDLHDDPDFERDLIDGF